METLGLSFVYQFALKTTPFMRKSTYEKEFNYMGIITIAIVEAKINGLIQKREKAIKNGDYERAWILRMKIDKYVTRMINLTYFSL